MSQFVGLSHSAIVSAADLIYVFNPDGKMIIFKISTNEYQIINNLIKTSYGCQGIMINNEFHAMGGFRNNLHLKWSKINKQFEILHDLQNDINWNNVGHFRVSKLKTKC